MGGGRGVLVKVPRLLKRAWEPSDLSPGFEDERPAVCTTQACKVPVTNGPRHRNLWQVGEPQDQHSAVSPRGAPAHAHTCTLTTNLWRAGTRHGSHTGDVVSRTPAPTGQAGETLMLKTTEMHPLTALEARSPKPRCGQGHGPPRDPPCLLQLLAAQVPLGLWPPHCSPCCSSPGRVPRVHVSSPLTRTPVIGFWAHPHPV